MLMIFLPVMISSASRSLHCLFGVTGAVAVDVAPLGLLLLFSRGHNDEDDDDDENEYQPSFSPSNLLLDFFFEGKKTTASSFLILIFSLLGHIKVSSWKKTR